MEKTKQDHMNEILAKVRDVKNSQESLIEKMAAIQLDLMNYPDKDLENAIVAAHSNASNNTIIIKDAIEKYEMEINAMEHR